MRKLLYLLGFLAILSFTTANHTVPTENGESYVSICNSDGAKKYHYAKNCRGLNACKHKIIKVTLQEAYKKGKKTLCGWED